MIKAEDYQDGDYDLTPPLSNSNDSSHSAVHTEGVPVHPPSPSPPQPTAIEPAETEVEEGEVVLPEQVLVDIPTTTTTTTTTTTEPVVFTDVQINEGIALGVATTSTTSSSSFMGKGKGKGKKYALLSSRTLQVYPKKGITETPVDVLLRRNTTHKTQRALIKTLRNQFRETNEECKRLRESQYMLLHQAEEIDLQIKRLCSTVGVINACVDSFVEQDMEEDSDLSSEEEEEEKEEDDIT